MKVLNNHIKNSQEQAGRMTAYYLFWMLLFRDCCPAELNQYIDSVKERSKASGLIDFCTDDDGELLLGLLNVLWLTVKWRMTHFNIVHSYILEPAFKGNFASLK
jgi:hypothetical protein